LVLDQPSPKTCQIINSA